MCVVLIQLMLAALPLRQRIHLKVTPSWCVALRTVSEWDMSEGGVKVKLTLVYVLLLGNIVRFNSFNDGS